MKENKPIDILIIGAGFAGVYAYLKLHKLFHKVGGVRITVVSEKDSFVFIPMIHEVATGTLSPSSITQSLRTLPHCCLDRLIEGRAELVNADKKEVEVLLLNKKKDSTKDEGFYREKVSYDFLISAIGSETNFFDTPGAEEYALPLKTLYDAKNMRNRIIEQFEIAETKDSKDERKRILSFVVVGGGATGVELAGELSDWFDKEMRTAFPSVIDDAKIHLVQGAEKLVPKVHPWFARKANRILVKKGVNILYNSRVKEVLEDKIKINEDTVDSGLVFWTAGVRAKNIDFDADQLIEIENKTRRIKVDEKLRLASYSNIYIAGDQAWVCDMEKRQPYPMRAQFAVREGEVAAENIFRALSNQEQINFSWKDQGFILSLGKGGALAEVYGLRFSGFIAWWIYRLAYASKILGFRAKLRTVLDWALNIFSARDMTKI